MERLINSCINTNNGYLELSFVGKNAVSTDKSTNVQFEHNGKKFFFKSADGSGGIGFKDKEIYESFISKILKRYTNTVEYFPAKYENRKGVVCEHWDNLGKGYTTFLSALEKKLKIPCWGVDSVDDFEFLYHNGDWDKFCAKDCLNEVRKAPIQLMAGNYDFKLSNMAVQCLPKRKLKNFLSFDYGFNVYALVDKFLKDAGMNLSYKNVEYAIGRLINSYFNVTLAFGATKNCINYEDFQSLYDDFYNYARKNQIFKNNLAKAVNMVDDVDEVFKEMEYYNLVLSKYKKDLIKRVMNYFATNYTTIIQQK